MAQSSESGTKISGVLAPGPAFYPLDPQTSSPLFCSRHPTALPGAALGFFIARCKETPPRLLGRG